MYFQFGAETNMEIHAHIFVGTYAFLSLEWVSQSGLIGAYGRHIFYFLRNCQTIFRQLCVSSSFSASCPTFGILSLLLILATQVGR